jgi:hypothetical protein
VLEGKPLFKDGREQVTAKRNAPLALVSYVTFQLHGIDLTLSEYGSRVLNREPSYARTDQLAIEIFRNGHFWANYSD